MTKQPKQGRHTAGLALLALLSALIWAGSLLYLHLGRGTLAFALTDVSGDAGKLRGFTVPMLYNNGIAWSKATLRDGYMENNVVLGQRELGVNEYSVYWESSVDLVVAPQVRAEVDRNATAVGGQTFDGIYYTTYASQASQLYEMLTLSLPDERSVCLQIGTRKTAEPMEVRTDIASLPYDAGNFDYVAWVPYPGVPSPVDSVSVLDGEYYACLQTGGSLVGPGVYRVVESLTVQEVAALPRGAMSGDNQTRLGTTPYGRVELFYTPPDAKRLETCFAMGDGLAVLYRNTQDRLCVAVVDHDGVCTDQREIRQYGDEKITVSLYPRQSVQDAVVKISCHDADTDKELSAGNLAFRVQDGTITAWDLCSWSSTPQYTESEDAADIIVLNKSGTAVLALFCQEEPLTLRDGLYQMNGHLRSSWRVAVYPFGQTRAAYIGRLDTVGHADWHDDTDFVYQDGWRVVGRDFGFIAGVNYLCFPTISVDRGMLS